MNKSFVSLIVILIAATLYSEEPPWQEAAIPSICTFLVPPSMELQAGVLKQTNNRFRKEVFKLESADRIVAQPKGMNAYNPDGFVPYARLIVEIDRGESGDYAKLYDPLDLSPDELDELNTILKAQGEKLLSESPVKSVQATIQSWRPVKVIKIMGVDALWISYIRVLSGNPPVVVNMYKIQNNDCLVTITTSYRESERDQWATELNKALLSFTFSER
jgi:hypothetical protein